MIDLRRLRVLRAVDYYGTVTAAASALNVTPSAASQQVRQLGRDLGVSLLEPDGRRVRLTSAARSLMTHADDIAARWEEAESALHSQDGTPSGVLTVSGFPVAISALLAPMAATLMARHSRLRVQVREVEVDRSFDLLFDGEVDLAVIEAAQGTPTSASPRFDVRPLVDDRFDLVVPVSHPLAAAGEVELGTASQEEWILPSQEGSCRTHVLAACSTAGFVPTAAHHSLDWTASAALVANGLGVALVPRLALLSPDLPIVRLPCAGSPGRRLMSATRAGSEHTPAVAAALEVLTELAADLGADVRTVSTGP